MIYNKYVRIFSTLILIAVLSIIATPKGWAGNYVVTLGGTGGITYSNGNGSAYSNAQGSFGGQGSTTGYVSCSGQLLLQYRYVPSSSTDDPPSCILLRESSSASWEGGSGSCIDCFGDPEVFRPATGTNQAGGTSGGVRYSVINNPGWSFVRSYYPQASAFSASSNPQLSKSRSGTQQSAGAGGSGGGNPGLPCSAGVWYSFIIYRPVIFFGGATYSNGVPNYLVGQACAPVLTWISQQGGGLPASVSISQCIWNPSGIVFADWTATQNSASTAQPPPLNVSAPRWRWLYSGGVHPERDGQHTDSVAVSAEVYVDGVDAGRADIGPQKVLLWRPYFSSAHIVGIARYHVDDAGVLQAESGSIEARPGMAVYLKFGTPHLFEQPLLPNAYGFGATAQLVKFHLYRNYYNDAVTQGNSSFEVDTEDSDWPYTEPQPAQIVGDFGTDYVLEDTPSLALHDFLEGDVMAYECQEDFRDYAMYQPPGVDVSWVPLFENDWKWYASGTEPWNGKPSDPAFLGEFYPIQHPTWSNHATVNG